MAVTLAVISVIVFTIIQLPPGDFLTTYIAQLQMQDQQVTEAEIASLKLQYGLDEPIYVQYFKWIAGILLRGDFGQSFQWNRPVNQLIGERLILTMVISMASMVFTYVVAIVIGI
jgi:peptide/nickel transport system permease protein